MRQNALKRTPLHKWIASHIGLHGDDLTRERIEAHQLGKLRATIDWAKAHSTFYREHLKGLGAEDLATLPDLTRFPFTTAEDIRHNPLRFLCVSQGEVSRVVTLQTSGTTGDPKRIFFGADDQERTIDFFHHGMSTLVGPRDRVLILMPGALPGSVGDLLVKGLDRLGAIGVPHGPVTNAFQTLDTMEAERIDSLVGIPTQVLGLARQSGGRAAPRSVLLSADHVPQAVSSELQRIWGCAVYTHYGMTEMGFGGGVECTARSGYHLREADLYFEIVDLETGAALPDGEPGEVVFTTLTRRAMPLIRYRTGDLSRFIPGPCLCGTTLRTMERVTLRLPARCTLEDGTALSMSDLDEAIFSVEGVLDFSATLSTQDGADCLQIEVAVIGRDRETSLRDLELALHSAPLIKLAIERGALTLQMALLPEGRPLARGLPKRAILDLRSV